MIRHNTKHKLMSLFFSDDTVRFRSPAEPDPGQTVTVRLRGPAVKRISAFLILNDTSEIPMKPVAAAPENSDFQFFEAQFVCPDEPVRYIFRIDKRGRDGEIRESYICRRNGTVALEACISAETDAADEDVAAQHLCAGPYAFRFTPGFHTPEWSKGAVQYQIFPDRFRNGDPGNDVQDGEYSYNHRHIRRIKDWYALPEADDYRCFYGGDIAGIIEKLDYLQDLGIEVIYLNPVFTAPSSHRYDTQDYDHIDPHLGVIEEDTDYCMKEWEHHNGYAQRYITRVLSKINTKKSDDLFADLCRQLHKRGMKIILDGVFNHCGSYHRWMDREGIYLDKPGYEPGAWQDEKSPYREYFNFTEEEPGFEAWWGVETLPKLCYENSRKLWEEIFSVAEKWLRPPYSIDGWRLDVAADLGHSPEINHAFWREFRERVKAVNPEALIIAEHYGDAEDWLAGDQWDSVMNYDAFMEPVTYFLTGMDKHSEGFRDDLYQDGQQFFEMMQENMDRFQWCSLQCAMNELSNHDHSRFLTRTNRTAGRTHTVGAAAADEGIDKAVMREAVVIQMTWPGAPTVYYGDEAGLTGWTDPDNRRCYPWGKEDKELIELHRSLISIRRRYPVLKKGSIIPLCSGSGWIAYARFDGKDCVIVACNNNDWPCILTIDTRKAEVPDGTRFDQVFSTGTGGHSEQITRIGTAAAGWLSVHLSAKSAVILANESMGDGSF